MELCMKIFLSCFFFCSLFLCVSCTTSQRFLVDGRGAGEVRKNIGRIEGSQQSIEEATSFIENYSSNIEEIIDREGELIEELRGLLRLIRERSDERKEYSRSKDCFFEYCFNKS